MPLKLRETGCNSWSYILNAVRQEGRECCRRWRKLGKRRIIPGALDTDFHHLLAHSWRLEGWNTAPRGLHLRRNSQQRLGLKDKIDKVKWWLFQSAVKRRSLPNSCSTLVYVPYLVPSEVKLKAFGIEYLLSQGTRAVRGGACGKMPFRYMLAFPFRYNGHVEVWLSRLSNLGIHSRMLFLHWLGGNRILGQMLESGYLTWNEFRPFWGISFSCSKKDTEVINGSDCWLHWRHQYHCAIPSNLVCDCFHDC